MILDFHSLSPAVVPHFKGGEGEAQETRCAACCGEGAAEACNAPAKRAGHKSR